MPSSTVENYLKQIYLEQQATGPVGERISGGAPGALVPMGRIAAAMGVVPGTATAMIKTLADSGLVTYEPREGVRLTRGGEQLALHVVRRHRLVELFLVQHLGLDWSEVHDEAEQLEHAISDKVLEKIDALLGHPSADPHGDPIPTAEDVKTPRGASRGRGKSRGNGSATLESLVTCDVGKTLRVARVIDQDAAFLQFATKQGLTPGTQVRVERRDTAADAVTLRANGSAPVTLGSTAAGKILVEAV